MQGIIEFLTYLWSIAGVPLILFFIPGVTLDEISKIIEKPIRQKLRQRFHLELNQPTTDMKLSESGEKMHERYKNNPQMWNRIINAIFFAGHILILLTGFLLLGFLGLLFFIIMDFQFIWARIKRPDVEAREKHVTESKARTAEL